MHNASGCCASNHHFALDHHPRDRHTSGMSSGMPHLMIATPRDCRLGVITPRTSMLASDHASVLRPCLGCLASDSGLTILLDSPRHGSPHLASPCLRSLHRGSLHLRSARPSRTLRIVTPWVAAPPTATPRPEACGSQACGSEAWRASEAGRRGDVDEAWRSRHDARRHGDVDDVELHTEWRR